MFRLLRKSAMALSWRLYLLMLWLDDAEIWCQNMRVFLSWKLLQCQLGLVSAITWPWIYLVIFASEARKFVKEASLPEWEIFFSLWLLFIGEFFIPGAREYLAYLVLSALADSVFNAAMLSFLIKLARKGWYVYNEPAERLRRSHASLIQMHRQASLKPPALK